MCHCDTNVHTQDHYMREKSLSRTHIRDSSYGMGCTSKGNSQLNMGGHDKHAGFLLGQVKRKSL